MAPSARAGKHSLKSYATGNEGASASQKVRAAEWRGELSWNKMSHPASGSLPSSYRVGGCPVEYDKPWFEARSGEWYCLLCNAYATDGHLGSDRHVMRSENPSWYGFDDAAGRRTEAPASFDEPWFEIKQGDLYCNLCGAFATDGHVASEKHKKRAAYPESYGFPAAAAVAAAAPAPPTRFPAGWCEVWSEEYSRHYYYNTVTNATQWEPPSGAGGAGQQSSSAGGARQDVAPVVAASAAAVACTAIVPHASPEYDKPWFELRDGEWYCTLCYNYATPGHIQSEKHKKRAAAPMWYGFNVSADTPATTSAAAPAAVAQTAVPPIPPTSLWERHFNEEHQRHFFYNATTRESTWELPEGARVVEAF